MITFSRFSSFNKIIKGVVLVLPLLFINQLAHGAVDNKGTDFFITFMPNFDNSVTIELHLTSDVETDVTIQYPINSPTFNDTVSVSPGEITIVNLPISTSTGWTDNAVQNNALRAFSSNEFVVYQVNRRNFSSDAALALPIDTMNTEYIVASYQPLVASTFAVTAGYDDTEVTITPKNSIGANPAGTPFNVTLQRGESFYGTSSQDLTGSIVSSSRPVSLINGNKCTNIKPGVAACDHVFEVAQPVQSWGTSSLAAPLANRTNGSVYRVIGSQDNTAVSINGSSIGTIDRGDFFETDSLPGEVRVTADKPIFVVQYMTGVNSGGTNNVGDPAMGNMIPTEQYFSDYTFSTVGGNQFVEHYLSIIASDDDVGSVLLDGAAIPSGEFTSIPTTGFSAATIPLTDGTHTTSSLNPHGITVSGYNSADSYLYPGGALFEFINPVGDPYDPVCGGQYNGSIFSGIVTDNFESEDINGNGVLDPGEDVNGNGIIDEDTGVFFVESSDVANANVTVDAFTPGDGEATFSVNWLDTGTNGMATITATDGAGNTCQLDVVFETDGEPPMMCDFDLDDDVDRNDINIIRAARNTPAAENDPMDIDGDGMITVHDARKCVLECTNARCAIVDQL